MRTASVVPFGCPSPACTPDVEPIEFFLGDDVQISVTATDGSSDQNPSDLTGCTAHVDFYIADNAVAIGTIDATVATPTGIISFVLPGTLTSQATPRSREARTYPCRAHVYVIDASTNRTTVGVVPFIPLKP